MILHYAISILVLLSALMPVTGTVAVQADPCSRDAVITSFAEAVSANEVDSWLQDYLDGDCPEIIKEGAQAFADVYTWMEVPPDEPDDSAASTAGEDFDITYGGEYPVLTALNALGFEESAEVQTLGPSITGLFRACGTTCFVLKTADGVYTGIPIYRFRQATYDAATGQYAVVLDHGEQLVGELVSDQVNSFSADESLDLGSAEQVTLTSLPEPASPPPPSTEPAWTLHVTGSADVTYTGIPVFAFVYYSTSGYLIGGSDHETSTTGFQVEVEGRFISVDITALQEIAWTAAGQVQVTTLNGNTAAGAMQFVATDSEGEHTNNAWSLVMRLEEDDQYIAVVPDAGITMTLTRN